MDPAVTVSVGIMAYNEEANLAHLIEALCHQRLNGFCLLEIIVVASGCTDATEAEAAKAAAQDRRVRLISQARREGKASAINLFLKEASGQLIVLESADTLPFPGTLQHLLAPFADAGVGMTGGRPRPINSKHGFMDYSAHFLWWMHHELAVLRPKLGELVAFRSLVRHIPEDTAVDEAAIEAAVEKAGYRIAYAGDARVRNKGPETVRDYFVQRRRIVAGHRHLHRTQGYLVSSAAVGLIFGTLGRKIASHARTSVHLVGQGRFRFLRTYLQHHSVRTVYLAGAVVMEAAAWTLGMIDYYVFHRNPFVWKVAESTKRLK
jgi:cellulose synthase/poly-beta-1,6-N-acetylglucosamine synthase-like glycosyltransferase